MLVVQVAPFPPGPLNPSEHLVELPIPPRLPMEALDLSLGGLADDGSQLLLLLAGEEFGPLQS